MFMQEYQKQQFKHFPAVMRNLKHSFEGGASEGRGFFLTELTGPGKVCLL
jgi:hypothetical protein